MKKIIFCCSIMGSSKQKTVYGSHDESMNVSDGKYLYPLNAYLANNISQEDDVKVVLIAKKDPFDKFKQNIVDFEEEVNDINKTIGAKIQIKNLMTDFSEESRIHHTLLDAIVDEIEEGTQITADITFGPKDVPFVVFAALNFAEKYLNCEVDRILYGKADFDENGKPVNTMLWDLASIYYINSISNKINCDNPQKARSVLKSILTI